MTTRQVLIRLVEQELDYIADAATQSSSEFVSWLREITLAAVSREWADLRAGQCAVGGEEDPIVIAVREIAPAEELPGVATADALAGAAVLHPLMDAFAPSVDADVSGGGAAVQPAEPQAARTRGPNKGMSLNLSPEEKARRGERLRAGKEAKRAAAGAAAASPVVRRQPPLQTAPEPVSESVSETAAAPGVAPTGSDSCEVQARTYIRERMESGEGIDRRVVADRLGVEIWDARKFITRVQDEVLAAQQRPRVGRPTRRVSEAIHAPEV